MILKSDVERVLSDYRENQEAILMKRQRTGDKEQTWKCDILGAICGN